MLIFELSPRLSKDPYRVWDPVHTIIQGDTCAVTYQHYRPPIPAQARDTQVMRPYPKCATQQHHTIAQCAYARRQTASCRTHQHHTIVQCTYARCQAVTHQHHTMALRAHARHQSAWCTTACSRDPALRTLTAILINLVTHGY
jgi:hypothetical protein